MNAAKMTQVKTTAPSTAPALKTAVAGQPRGRYDDILALQRAAGNRVVSRLFLAGRGAPRTVSQEMLPVVQRALDVNKGGALDLHTRAEMEARFGQDLNDVRVHTDPRAADSARAIGARAYTVGRHVVFAPTQYAPHTGYGRALIAHELAHVLQQCRGSAAAGAAAAGNLTAQCETQADQAGRRMSDPSPALRSGGPNPHGAIASGLTPAPMGTLQGQFVTPHAAGGGFGGLLERDRRATFAERPAIDPAYAQLDFAIRAGWRVIAALDKPTLGRATVDQRVTMLTQLTEAYWTGDAEEEAIIRILSTTPSSDAPALIARLDAPLATGKCLFDELERVVDVGNNLDLHTEISRLRLRAMPPSKGVEALRTAPVLPWHDVMGFFEDSATFRFWLTEKGKIRICYYRGTALLSSTDFADEIRLLLPQYQDLFLSGFDFDPDQLLMIHDYDREQHVPVMARDLLGYRHAGKRGFLAHAGEVASVALPLGPAKTVAGKAAVIAFERVIPIASTIVSENRLNIMRWFPTWGRRMLYFNDLVQAGVGLYGIVQFARSGVRIIKSWREVGNAPAALKGAAPDPKAEPVARQLEQRRDAIIEGLEKIREAEEAATPPNVGMQEPKPAGGSVGAAAEAPSKPIIAAALPTPITTVIPAKPPAGPAAKRRHPKWPATSTAGGYRSVRPSKLPISEKVSRPLAMAEKASPTSFEHLEHLKASASEHLSKRGHQIASEFHEQEAIAQAHRALDKDLLERAPIRNIAWKETAGKPIPTESRPPELPQRPPELPQWRRGVYIHQHGGKLPQELKDDVNKLAPGMRRKLFIIGDCPPQLKEFTIYPTKYRVDHVDWDRRIIYEIKPNTIGEKVAKKELDNLYKPLMDKYYTLPGQESWNVQPLIYDVEVAERILFPKKWW